MCKFNLVNCVYYYIRVEPCRIWTWDGRRLRMPPECVLCSVHAKYESSETTHQRTGMPWKSLAHSFGERFHFSFYCIFILFECFMPDGKLMCSCPPFFSPRFRFWFLILFISRMSANLPMDSLNYNAVASARAKFRITLFQSSMKRILNFVVSWD